VSVLQETVSELSPRELALLAAARLRIGGRRLRAIARGDIDSVRSYTREESSRRLAEARREAHADAQALGALGARVLVLGDEEYPDGLAEIPDAPPFLAVRGRLPVGGVAVIGSRQASIAGCAYAAGLVIALGRPVVAGLARGIDAVVHGAAMAARVPQVAYVGSGITQMYPPEHSDLAEAIVAAGGAVASERLPDEGPSRWSLIRRDRLQAAHAHAVVLVESELEGGAMHTMDFAQRYGRLRFALDNTFAGNQRAIAEGAIPLPTDPGAAAACIEKWLVS
jgi:DNA processing protein